MPKSSTNLRRFICCLKALGLTSSLTLGSFSCQTSGTRKPDAETQEKAVLESQKDLVRNALDTGKPESALKSLRDLLLVFPDDASLQNLMGLTQLALKNTMRAQRHFQIAYKLSPEVATGLNLSSALIEAGEYRKAQKLLLALSKVADKSRYRYKERIYHNLGYCALKQNQISKAEEWYKVTLEENPTYFPAHMEVARLYEDTGRPLLAMQSYRQAVDYCRNCFEPVEALTRLYVTTGQANEAKRLITQFLRNEELPESDRMRAVDLLSRVPHPAPAVGKLSPSIETTSPATR